MLPSGLPEKVSNEEPLARFLNSSRLFNTSGRIKPAAFMPRDGETSVFRVDTMGDDELWETGEKHLDLPKGRQIHGVAFVSTRNVWTSGLDIEAKEPPPRHANILGWQEGDDLMAKARNKELSARVAQHATLTRAP